MLSVCVRVCVCQSVATLFLCLTRFVLHVAFFVPMSWLRASDLRFWQIVLTG